MKLNIKKGDLVKCVKTLETTFGTYHAGQIYEVHETNFGSLAIDNGQFEVILIKPNGDMTRPAHNFIKILDFETRGLK